MVVREQASLGSMARVMKSLGHTARLRMVEELSKGERCVCVLTELVGLDMSTVSRHLAMLVNAGVLSSEKRGNQVFYRLRTPCVMKFFNCICEVLGS